VAAVGEEERVATKIESYCPEGVYDPPGYSQGVKVTGAQTILFLAGQVAYDKDGTPKHKGDFKAQARECFACIKRLVEGAGGTVKNVVKINTYVTDIANRPTYREARKEAFGDHEPASTMVQVSALAMPEYLIEIEAIAVI
jgi:2-iminobutanoate/2-iminopropanoate deaminase